MGDLRMKFCTDYEMKLSNLKFVLDGQRIHDDETANTLGLVNGDVIEIFTEMLGGGWPHKKNIYSDTNKIHPGLLRGDRYPTRTYAKHT